MTRSVLLRRSTGHVLLRSHRHVGWHLRRLLHGRLLLISHHLLSVQELVHLTNLLLEELRLFDELVEFLNTVEKTSRNLSCQVAVDILNREKDRVSDELGLFVSGLQRVEFRNVD